MPRFNILNSVDRRSFLAGCSAAGVAGAAMAAVPGATAAEADALLPDVKTRIGVVFTHPNPKRQGWPSQDYDYEGRKKMLLGKLREGCPKAEFLPTTTMTKQEAVDFLENGPEVDGYLVYLIGIPSRGSDVFANSGRPVILVDDLYGGTGRMLGLYPKALQKGMPVAAVSSSRFEDVIAAVRALESMKKMRSSVLLDVTDRDLGETISLYRQTLGVTVRKIGSDELNSAFESAPPAEARKVAARWIDNARRVVEPSTEEIEKSAAMYLGMKSLLAKYNAQGIAVDCLGLFYGHKMHAYPCLGFFQLNSDGWVGACEADLHSASTMLLMHYLVGRPGYISDPVIDTSKNEIVYAHCVATNKVFGPSGPENPYDIRSHPEDHKGAAIRSLMPVDEVVTSLKFVPERKAVVMHQATTAGNINEERACRTKLAAKVGNARKLLEGWDYGWHRVTFFGDHTVPVKTVSALLGFQVAEEG